MALTNEQRKDVWAGFMKAASQDRDNLGAVSKGDLRDAVDNLDDWLEANQAEINQVLPPSVRQSFSTGLKARLLMFVVEKRYL